MPPGYIHIAEDSDYSTHTLLSGRQLDGSDGATTTPVVNL